MTLKLSIPVVVSVAGVAACVAYLAFADYAAAGWSAIAAVLAGVMAWDAWKNHGARIGFLPHQQG